MRKIMVLLLAAGLIWVFATPASAFENIFGGYMRTRAYVNANFSGEDQTEAQDRQVVDTRTRLYYTAKFNDAFKFVNKFEFNNTWGDTDGGDIGADATDNLRVKNSYVDFTLGNLNSKIGMQGATLCRGLLFDDDFSGAVFTYKAGDIAIPFIWAKAYEGYNIGAGTTDRNDYDVDYYGINPVLKLGDATVKPIFLWITSKDAESWTAGGTTDLEKTDVYILGADVDMDMNGISLWFTGLYEFGSADLTAAAGGGDADLSAYLVALGASADVNDINVHGQIFYATGDDDDTDTDLDAFWVPKGQSYYWAEIMGYGIFDYDVSANSCADQISDIMAINVGVTVKPMPKLSLTADLWYASLAEDDANGEDVLGTEIDLIATYALMDNLKLDVVGAYLFAGDATYSGTDDADPYEFGTRISFGF